MHEGVQGQGESGPGHRTFEGEAGGLILFSFFARCKKPGRVPGFFMPEVSLREFW
jgi:hypothetical protein